MNQFDRYYEQLRQDCRHFEPHRPCRPHKLRGQTCESCDEYEAMARRVLIVKLAATGDVLRTTSFLPGIRKRHPDAELHWLTLPVAAPLFEGNPLVDRLHLCDGKHLPVLLEQTPFDAIYCPDADRETAALAAAAPLRTGGRRIGYAFEDGRVVPIGEAARRWFVMGVSDDYKRANRETYQNLVAAAIGLALPMLDRPMLLLSDAERGRAREWWQAEGRAGFLLGLNTGAGRRWPQKQWSCEGQVALVQRVHAVGGITMLLGGPEESERHQQLLAAVPEGAVIDAGTENTLRDFAARLELCDLVVTGDTMALHMACAFGKPVVALFGPTSPWEIELYGSGRKCFAEQLECLVCYGTCEKTPNCQDLISVEEVWRCVEALRGA
ncbi:MAG: hypothetical protein CSA62_14260 [Planctomycetota bacterium]|nr:MAG: hypothetical protein CSA62_14260 [Planctomycetota bacterium]